MDIEEPHNPYQPDLKFKQAERHGWQVHAPCTLGVVLSDPKDNEAEIQLTSGEIFSKVRLSGGYPKNGSLHGKLGGVKKNQLVMVGFSQGVSRLAYVIEVYPFYVLENEVNEFETFSNKWKSDFDEANDIMFGHDSGYAVIFKPNKVKILDRNNTSLIELDTLTKKLKIGDGSVKAVNTNELKNWMQKSIDYMKQIKTAIQGASVAPLDGGATFKTSILAGLTATVPDIPDDIEKTNVSYSE
jgi:hypothetical protein